MQGMQRCRKWPGYAPAVTRAADHPCICEGQSVPSDCRSDPSEERDLRVRGRYFEWSQSRLHKPEVENLRTRPGKYDARATGLGASPEAQFRGFMIDRAQVVGRATAKLRGEQVRTKGGRRNEQLFRLEIAAVALAAYDAGVLFGPAVFEQGGMVKGAMTQLRNRQDENRSPEIRRALALQHLEDSLAVVQNPNRTARVKDRLARRSFEAATNYDTVPESLQRLFHAALDAISSLDEKGLSSSERDSRLERRTKALQAYGAAVSAYEDRCTARRPWLFLWRFHQVLFFVRSQTPDGLKVVVPDFRLQIPAALWTCLRQVLDGPKGAAGIEAARFAASRRPVTSPGHAYMQEYRYE